MTIYKYFTVAADATWTFLVFTQDQLRISRFNRRQDLSEVEKADQVFAMRVTQCAHLVDNVVRVGEEPIKKKYGEEKWENTKIITALGVSLAEFNEALHSDSFEKKEEMFLLCAQNLLRNTSASLEYKRERCKGLKDSSSQKTYEFLTKLRQDMALFDTGLSCVHILRDRQDSEKAIDCLATVCSYLDLSAQFNKDLLESQPELDRDRHIFESGKQKLATIAPSLVYASSAIQKMRNPDLSWEEKTEQGLHIVSLLAGCTHRLGTIEIGTPHADQWKKVWWGKIQFLSASAVKIAGLLRSGIRLSAPSPLPPSILAPNEVEIAEAMQEFDTAAIDADNLYPRELPVPDRFQDDPVLGMHRCPITNRPIREIVAVRGTDTEVYFEFQAILAIFQNRNEHDPLLDAWPLHIAFDLENLERVPALQNMINRRLEELAREEMGRLYRGLAEV